MADRSADRAASPIYRAADPTEFCPVEFNLWLLQELIKKDRRLHRPNRQSIGFRNIIKMIGADDRSRPGHVLHNESWLSWNMFAHMRRQQARVQIVDAPGANTGHNRNRFSLIEPALRAHS